MEIGKKGTGNHKVGGSFSVFIYLLNNLSMHVAAVLHNQFPFIEIYFD
jgi:hypothetical protein